MITHIYVHKNIPFIVAIDNALNSHLEEIVATTHIHQSISNASKL